MLTKQYKMICFDSKYNNAEVPTLLSFNFLHQPRETDCRHVDSKVYLGNVRF